MGKKRKKKTAPGKKQSLTKFSPSILVRIPDGCSDDVIRENIEIAIRNIAVRSFQSGVFK